MEDMYSRGRGGKEERLLCSHQSPELLAGKRERKLRKLGDERLACARGQCLLVPAQSCMMSYRGGDHSMYGRSSGALKQLLVDI